MKCSEALFACWLLAGATARADTQTITLSCDLEMTEHPPYGPASTTRETDNVEMLSIGADFKAITIHSNKIPVSVLTSKSGDITGFVDNSDGNRWDISTDRSSGNSAPLQQQRAAIDRDTGRLTAWSLLTMGGLTARTEASGTCTKLDTTHPKF